MFKVKKTGLKVCEHHLVKLQKLQRQGNMWHFHFSKALVGGIKLIKYLQRHYMYFLNPSFLIKLISKECLHICQHSSRITSAKQDLEQTLGQPSRDNISNMQGGWETLVLPGKKSGKTLVKQRNHNPWDG